MNENNASVDLLDDLLKGRKTVDEVNAELREGAMYLRAGKNYRALKLDGRAKINGIAVNCYIAGEKVNNEGLKVEAKQRTPKPAGTKGKGK